LADRVLTLRELNRATLGRQLLLARRSISAEKAIVRVAGLQAQAVIPPFVGLWTRIEGFRREQLTKLVQRRRVVRGTLMRHTLHLTTADEYLVLRPAIQPALTRSFNGTARARMEGLDLGPIVAAGRARLDEGPATFAELRALVSKLAPDRDENVLAYAVRTFLKLVQVPAGGPWGYSTTAPYALADDFLGQPVADHSEPGELILRYLAAFGPASARDIQAWSGLGNLEDAIDGLRPVLRTFQDERGTELFDVRGGRLPAGDTPAPVRFLPDYDNVLLAFTDRSRVIADEYRQAVFLTAGRVRATFLVDGFVAGTWKLERAKDAASLAVEPFGRLSKKDRQALRAEGERLIRFQEPDVSEGMVRFAEPD
jgi:hypothetical protein